MGVAGAGAGVGVLTGVEAGGGRDEGGDGDGRGLDGGAFVELDLPFQVLGEGLVVCEYALVDGGDGFVVGCKDLS